MSHPRDQVKPTSFWNKVALTGQGWRNKINHFRSGEFKLDMLDLLLTRLKLWSLLVLPILGYLIGQVLQYLLSTKTNSRYESLLVHGITMIVVVATFNDILYNPASMSDLQSKALLLSIAYLFVFGCILGVIV